MSLPSFIANTPAIIQHPIINNGFWPDVSVQEFEKAYRIDESFDATKRLARLEQALRLTNAELHQQFCAWSRMGYATLEDVPQEEQGDKKVLIESYKTAVFAKAMELMSNRYRATDTTMHALPRAEAQEKVADQYLIEYREAILMLAYPQGSFSSVELI
ncbi:Phage head completion protein (GPL) [Thiothrix eikelboomii]|uniref:Phage head completion protein (GPL) n=1 Tax=Thiothrix eikelboomii TaxID=92487 RepID=A0A1T4WWI6_9GAMM|nr:head completion/stabilization protein [Thiothrix eikelboomii]SKA81228.1 Phage head completion protein (GPL) [Thiothrix eikelboomii]